MARITRYTQDKLASSMVGTPGVDRSGEILGNSLEQGMAAQARSTIAAEQTSRYAADRSQAVMMQEQAQAVQEMRVAQATIKAVEKVQRGYLIEEKAASLSDQLNLALIDAKHRAYEDYRDKPELAPTKYKESAEGIIRDFYRDNGLDSDHPFYVEVAGKVRSATHGIMPRHYEDMHQFAFTEGTRIAKNNLQAYEAEVVQRAGQAGLAGNRAAFEELVKGLSDAGPRYLRVFGEGEGYKSQLKTMRDASITYLRGLAETAPGAAEAEMNLPDPNDPTKKWLSNVLLPDDVKEIKAYERTQVERAEHEAQKQMKQYDAKQRVSALEISKAVAAKPNDKSVAIDAYNKMKDLHAQEIARQAALPDNRKQPELIQFYESKMRSYEQRQRRIKQDEDKEAARQKVLEKLDAKKRRDAETAFRQAQTEQAKVVFNSPEAMQARAEITRMFKTLEDRKIIGEPAEAAMISKLSLLVDKASVNGWLDVATHDQVTGPAMVGKVAAMLDDHMQQAGAPRDKDEDQKSFEDRKRYFDWLMSEPPKEVRGMHLTLNHPNKHDALDTAFRALRMEQWNDFRRDMKREPTQSELALMDANILSQKAKLINERTKALLTANVNKAVGKAKAAKGEFTPKSGMVPPPPPDAPSLMQSAQMPFMDPDLMGAFMEWYAANQPQPKGDEE